VAKDFGKFKLLIDFEKDIFGDFDNIFSFSQHFLFGKDKFEGKIGLKYIEEDGFRFLPNFLYQVNNNFSVFLTSNFYIPNLWDDLIFDNWKNIKKENYKSEEIYKGGIRFKFKENFLEISHSFNKKYLWEKNENNFYLPQKENFHQTSFLFNLKIPFTEKIKSFLNFEKNIFYNDIFTLPENNYNLGLEYLNESIKLKIWNSYIGERNFPTKRLKSFSTLNFEISYIKKVEFGFSIYNITNNDYEVAPDYPGEKRKFIFFIRF
ncbi:MAG: hypothetical protein NZ891_06100, partial [bacterium]|nr:hypothetical protein [bacterium]MDW8164295.1 hypothetical protein [Candidatus Omnitrophota bacterium]